MSAAGGGKPGFMQRLLHGASSGKRAQTTLGSRVLVIDDSSTVCAALSRMLVQEGYQVLTAVDGQAGIISAIKEQPALIFLDVVMPGLNGFDVLRALRHHPRTEPIPIVMISGNAQATEQFYLQRFGADGFVKKPFGPDEVYQCIGQLVLSGRLMARSAEESANVMAGSPEAGDAIDSLADVAEVH